MKKPFLLRIILTVLLLYPLSNSAHPINNLFDFSRDIFANADGYGVTNTTGSCLVGVTFPSSPKPECYFETYAFFETIHPTAKLHGRIGDAIAVALPEPLGFVLMAIGLSGLGFDSRERKRA